MNFYFNVFQAFSKNYQIEPLSIDESLFFKINESKKAFDIYKTPIQESDFYFCRDLLESGGLVSPMKYEKNLDNKLRDLYPLQIK
jgi:hypothetical protein